MPSTFEESCDIFWDDGINRALFDEGLGTLAPLPQLLRVVDPLPFVDEAGKLAGRVTLKNIMKFSCLPEYMVEMTPLLGSFMSCVENAEEKVKEVLCNPVTDYVREHHATINSDAAAIKALAMMEKNDTSYIFVVDDGEYQGIITIQGIAARMSELGGCGSVTKP